MRRYWVGVANRDHVRRAVEGGFCQLNHGRQEPLKRIAEDDGMLYYSPREQMNAGAPLKAFTAIGKIMDSAPYQVDQSTTFRPFRRKTLYFKGEDAAIRPMIDTLSFSRGNKNWGLVLRRGFFEIEERDFDVIAEAMKVQDR